ncbi:MAG: hypothetical protein EOP11_06620 [Proteobacteria bacterium]|nr:MAG: hypothetical protein EOP11_06620 [Pseudomonadota bacterium]
MKLSLLAFGFALAAGTSAFAAEPSSARECTARDRSEARAVIEADGSLTLNVRGQPEATFAAQSQKQTAEGYLLYTGYSQALGQHSLVNLREKDGRALVQAFGNSYEFTCAK